MDVEMIASSENWELSGRLVILFLRMEIVLKINNMMNR